MNRRQEVSPADAKAAWARIKKGETSVMAEAKALGLKDRVALRNAIIALVGPEHYRAAMTANAGMATKRWQTGRSTAEAE